MPRTATGDFRIWMLHARQRLLDPQERRTIWRIALDVQIMHLGRFSERYAVTFGEAPSSTIAFGRDQQKPVEPKTDGGHFDVRTMEYRDGASGPR